MFFFFTSVNKDLKTSFDEIVCNPTHSLHSLLPQRKSCKYALRRKSDFTLPLCRTKRLKNSFIFSHVYKM